VVIGVGGPIVVGGTVVGCVVVFVVGAAGGAAVVAGGGCVGVAVVEVGGAAGLGAPLWAKAHVALLNMIASIAIRSVMTAPNGYEFLIFMTQIENTIATDAWAATTGFCRPGLSCSCCLSSGPWARYREHGGCWCLGPPSPSVLRFLLRIASG
jgi:hypothetical protein